jgi:hypothetical protein
VTADDRPSAVFLTAAFDGETLNDAAGSPARGANPR